MRTYLWSECGGCKYGQMTDRVREWFKQLPEPATVVFDSE